MFLRYSGCIWKTPCVPYCKQRETARWDTEGYPR